MQELVKIEEKDGNQVVSARVLHEALEIKKDFTDWIKAQIESLGLIVDEDFSPFWGTSEAGRTISDYSLTIETAKHISMASRSEKGKTVRKYFIECEKKAKSLTIPQTLPEALRLAADLADKNQVLLSENTEMKPKAEFYDQVIGSNSLFEMGQIAKLVNVKGYGRNNLFEFLRDNKIIKAYSTEPYQSYVDNGWFKVIEVKWVHPTTSATMLSLKTMVYQKGLDGIRKLLVKP
jgi:anti-repressor protein